MTSTLYFPSSQGEGREWKRRLSEQQQFDELYPFDDGIGAIEREIMQLMNSSGTSCEALPIQEGVRRND